MADRLVKQHAGPAGAEHDLHFAGGGGDRLEVGQRLCERDVDRPVPGLGLEQIVVEIAPAKPVIAGLAPVAVLRDELDVEPHQRPDVVRDEAVGADDVDHAPACGERDATWATRGSRARAAASICWHSATLSANGIADSGSSAMYIAWLVRAGGGAGTPLAGSSSFNVAAARSIAAALISLAWAKAVVSPDTPRRPKPERCCSRRSSAARHRTRTPRSPNIGGRARHRRKTQDALPQAALRRPGQGCGRGIAADPAPLMPACPRVPPQGRSAGRNSRTRRSRDPAPSADRRADGRAPARLRQTRRMRPACLHTVDFRRRQGVGGFGGLFHPLQVATRRLGFNAKACVACPQGTLAAMRQGWTLPTPQSASNRFPRPMWPKDAAQARARRRQFRRSARPDLRAARPQWRGQIDAHQHPRRTGGEERRHGDRLGLRHRRASAQRQALDRHRPAGNPLRPLLHAERSARNPGRSLRHPESRSEHRRAACRDAPHRQGRTPIRGLCRAA